MAKDNILDRTSARLRRGSPSATDDASPGGDGAPRRAARSVIRRRSSAKEAPAPAAAPAAAPVAAKTTRRRRSATPEPAPVEAPAVDEAAPAEAAPPAAAVEDSTPEPAPEPAAVEAEAAAVAEEPAESAAEETAAPEPVEAASEEGSAAPEDEGAASPQLDELLADAPARKRVHKVLSDEEVAADASGKKKVAKAAPAAAPAAEEPAAEAPAAAADAAPAAASAPAEQGDKGASLEDLLKEQGIVQHKPKKGRRIIEDEMTAGAAAFVKPQAPAAPRGVSLFASPDSRNKPVRFLDPATIQREREARERRGRGKRKAVVNRRDALYGGNDRRRRKGRGSSKPSRPTELTTPAAHKRVVKIHGTISVGDLADQLGIKAGPLIKMLVGMGQLLTIHEQVDLDTAQLVAGEFNYEVEDVSFKEEALIEQDTTEGDVEEGLEPRAPVVTIMGHVDHGKTSLLDAIRKARVAEGEAGGITQHVSAFDVRAGGQQITFVDTPGHAAFTAMRARGAQMTDIVVLVVAAPEGVMPQTAEVISHAKAADVPIIVALNKMDLKEANPDKAKQQLAEHELMSEDWGGETQVVPMSAKTGDGIDDLLEAINLQAEILELKANPKRSAQGRVVEAQFEKGRGPVAIVLVQKGTLSKGDFVVAGVEYGRVRALFETGAKKPKTLKTAGPSSPVAILGLSGLPSAGDEFAVVKNEKDAKAVAEHRREQARTQHEGAQAGVNLQDIYRRMQEGDIKELNLIVKADVQGSIEALKKVFDEIEVRDTRIRVLHSAVGGVTEGDVTLAEASSAVIVGFGVRPDSKARALAERVRVDIRSYRVIYEAVDEIKQALVGMLDPEYQEKVIGHAEVRDTFKISKLGTIAGCSVQDGKLGRNHSIRVLRNSVVVWEGKLKSLRRFKDDVREVLQGYECGVGLDGFDDLKVGDNLETFIVEEIRPVL